MRVSVSDLRRVFGVSALENCWLEKLGDRDTMLV